MIDMMHGKKKNNITYYSPKLCRVRYESKALFEKNPWE
jgi:hypothetical protein